MTEIMSFLLTRDSEVRPTSLISLVPFPRLFSLEGLGIMRPSKRCQPTPSGGLRKKEVFVNPRLDSSLPKNRTSLPPDAVRLIEQTVKEQFESFLADKELIVRGDLYLKELLLSIGYREKGGIRQRNFEASLDFDLETQNPMDLIHLALDGIDSMFQQWIEAEGDLEVPVNWTAFPVEGKSVWLRSTNINSDLEAQADAILGEEFLKREAEITEETVDALFAEIRAGALRADESLPH